MRSWARWSQADITVSRSEQNGTTLGPPMTGCTTRKTVARQITGTARESAQDLSPAAGGQRGTCSVCI